MASSPLGDEKLLKGKLFSAVKVEDGRGTPWEEFKFKNLDQFGDYLNLNWKLTDIQDQGKEKSQMVSCDIPDLLPSDPFGMDISARFEKITWIEEVDKDSGLKCFGDETEEKEMGDDRLFAEVNLVWKGSMRIYPGVGDGKLVGSGDNKEVLDGNIEEVRSFMYENLWFFCDEAEEVQECIGDCSVHDEGGAPPDALFYALGHLGVQDLLSVERVCKSLCDAVQNDPLLWRSIHIDQQLGTRITDDSLLQLTSRAKGSLKCLSLEHCFQISDSALHCVFQSNPWLTKLCVPGCVRLSMDGIISSIKAQKSAGLPGIKHLRIGGRLGVTEKHFEELNCMLAVDNNHIQQLSTRKPRIYRGGQLYPDDDRALDVELCPICQQIRPVYDCPVVSCQSKNRACRGCTCCISRCHICGRCLDECDYMEMFALEARCLDCLFSTCQERDKGTRITSKSIFREQDLSYFLLPLLDEIGRSVP